MKYKLRFNEGHFTLDIDNDSAAYLTSGKTRCGKLLHKTATEEAYYFPESYNTAAKTVSLHANNIARMIIHYDVMESLHYKEMIGTYSVSNRFINPFRIYNKNRYESIE